MLTHLAIALVRSILTYGQEVYFSASKSLLKRIESLDTRALKIALGVPIHTSNKKVYNATNILPLDDFRKQSCAKYIARANKSDSFNLTELSLKSDMHYPKRAQNISYLQSIASYVNDVFSDKNISEPIDNFIPPAPPWELNKATFDIFHSTTRKQDNIHLLACETREHLEKNYFNSLKVFTDGSLCESGDTGAGFVIPALNINKSYYLGKNHSIFTAELIAILMALITLVAIPRQIFDVVLCVDSQSVLQSLNSNNPKERQEIIYEIKHNISILINNGSNVQFCWVPSHCGLLQNDYADFAAKRGAKNVKSDTIDIPYSTREKYHIIENQFRTKSNSSVFGIIKGQTRRISSLALRLYLNAWGTKFCKDIFCSCKEMITLDHVIFNCKDFEHLRELIKVSNIKEIELKEWVNISIAIIETPIEQYL